MVDRFHCLMMQCWHLSSLQPLCCSFGPRLFVLPQFVGIVEHLGHTVLVSLLQVQEWEAKWMSRCCCYLVYVRVVCIYYVCASYVCLTPWNLEDRIGSPATASYQCWESSPGPLEKQDMLLTSKSSLQPNFQIICFLLEAYICVKTGFLDLSLAIQVLLCRSGWP